MTPENKAFISNIGLHPHTVRALNGIRYADDVEALINIAFARGRAAERARAVEVVRPFATIFAEHDEDLPPDGDRHAWGFNGADLYWRDFRRAAAYITDDAKGEG